MKLGRAEKAMKAKVSTVVISVALKKLLKIEIFSHLRTRKQFPTNPHKSLHFPTWNSGDGKPIRK